MIVYVESNFILELAYLQEQHEACEELLGLADAGTISVVLPAFSVTEARLSLRRRAHRRLMFHHRLSRELRELSRSRPYQELATTTEPLTRALVESGEAEKQRLELTLSRLIAICQVLPVQDTTIRSAIQYETSLKLSPNDALVFASIVEDLAGRPQGPKCFLNRNSKDFANPDVYDELSTHDCKMLPSFKDGVGYIRAVTTPPACNE